MTSIVPGLDKAELEIKVETMYTLNPAMHAGHYFTNNLLIKHAFTRQDLNSLTCNELTNRRLSKNQQHSSLIVPVQL